MKNYAGFFAVLAILCTILAYNGFVVVKTDARLVDGAHELRNMCDRPKEELLAAYESFAQEFFANEALITSFINHSSYNEAKNNIIKIRYDIEYSDMRKLKSDVEELISYLEDISDNEKLKINNIF